VVVLTDGRISGTAHARSYTSGPKNVHKVFREVLQRF
jgi:hypothetical protein